MAANRGKEVIVLDLGSCYSKVGFAGEGAPRKIVSLPIPTSGARNGRAELAPARSYEEQMEAAIRKLLLRELMSSPKDKKVLVAEDLFAPAQTRETVLRILLEKLKASTVLLIPSPVLALYASGLEGDVSGLVVLSGYSETTVLPISNRLPLIYSSISSTELGSEMLHASMLQLAQDGELQFQSQNSRLLDPLVDCSTDLDDILLKACLVSPREGSQIGEVAFQLSSGAKIRISSTARRVGSLLFGDECGRISADPERSIARLALEALLKCPIDARAQVASRIVLAGGVSMLQGFQNRFMQDLKFLCSTNSRFSQLANLVENKAQVANLQFTGNTLPWVGGSAYAAASNLSEAITAERFQKGERPLDPLLAGSADAECFNVITTGVDLSWPMRGPN